MYTEVHSWTAHGCPMFKPSPYGNAENLAAVVPIVPALV